MTAKTCSNKLNDGQPEHPRKRTRLFAILPWLVVAPLLTSCVGTIISPPPGAPPGPPSHTNAWLSYKVSFGCGPIGSCQGLLDFNDANGILSEASKYYCSIGIDPTDCANGVTPKYTFTQWKKDNGFPVTGFPPAHAFYFNKGDLQLGRDMNCVQNGPNGQNVACYVSNYGPPPFDVAAGKENAQWPNPDAAVDAAINQVPPKDPSGNGLFATVAMIFNPNGVGPNGDAVTFYVFNENGDLVNNAALDGEGGKSVPRMCMACHGGSYSSNTAAVPPFNSKAPGINFLPFDVWFFHYSQTVATNSLGNADLQEGFRKLNYLVKLTHSGKSSQETPDTDKAIIQAIDDQYNEAGQCGGANQPPCGVENPGSQVPVDPPPPSGWSANATLYKAVFRPYCRMCHVGQGNFTFQDVNNLSPTLVQSLVCTSHDMPHAEVPFGGQSGSNLRTGLWWDLQALSDLNAFLNGQPGCH